MTVATPVYAPIWKRLMAALYDLLPLLALMFMTTAVLLPFTGGEAMPERGLGHIAYQLLLYGLGAAYYIVSWQRGGQTIGMRAWRLRVRTDSGEPLSFKSAALRFLCSLISIAVLGLGLLWGLFDARRRMWHDRWTRTQVILIPKR